MSDSVVHETTGEDAKVVVVGLGYTDVQQALKLYESFLELQSSAVGDARSQLIHAAIRSGLDLVPPASLEQARRMAAVRDRLLATPAFTYDTLAELRNDATVSATRTWVSRRRDAREMFTVSDHQRTVIPAFQFDETGRLRDELAPLIGTLVDAGVDGWPLWLWLTSTTGWLSGAIPEQVAATDPARALFAAQRFVAA